MTPMLNCYPERRILSDVMLRHTWVHKKSSNNYHMYILMHLGLNRNIKKLRLRDMIYKFKKTKFINTNLKIKMLKLKIMEPMIQTMMTNFMDMKKQEISGTSIEVLWIWGTSDMETAFSQKNSILDQIGSFRLDSCMDRISFLSLIIKIIIHFFVTNDGSLLGT